MGLGLSSFWSPFLPTSPYGGWCSAAAGSAAQTGFALGLTHPGWLEGTEVSLLLLLSLLLKFWWFLQSGNEMRTEPLVASGCLWVKAGLWFCGC